METTGKAVCEHEPEDGTLYTATGLAASLSRELDFPVEAVCAKCSQPIRREQHEVTHPGGDWQLKYPLPRERLAAFKTRHPQVTVSADSRTAAWFDDDGPHQVTYDSPLELAGYLEARFDR